MTLAPQLEPVPAAPDEGTAGARVRRGRGRGERQRSGLALGRISGVSLGVVTLWISLLVLLPLAAVVGKAFGSGWSDFTDAITSSATASALKLTLGLAAAVAVVNAVMGTLVAWVLVRERFRGAGLLETVIDIPFALPTVVAGIVVLALYGQNSPVGVTLYGERAGLVVALLFVTLPFTVRTVQPVLLDLDRDAEQAAASLGASPVVVFRRIVLPQILPAAASGAALSFARAIGEYGSLVFISSGLKGNKVASFIIYGQLQNADTPGAATRQAAAIAFVLLLASAVVLILLDLVQRRVARRG
ncbi:ABC transporter permease [uncultured Jatrophihabitans sp.]|uniref:ABC transporter permease n=1 Tax=uncultured Jatrophihabitans sp. TaxID=1610747 RepID=UPI0035CBCC7A